MIKVDNYSSDFKITRGKNVGFAQVLHDWSTLDIDTGVGRFSCDGKMARQIYQVLKKHYETPFKKKK